MENIETLLAAVAQTQGFDDDPVESTAPKASSENSESRAGNNSGVGVQRIGEVSGNVQQSTVAAAPPTAPIPSISAARQMIGAGEKRKRGRPPKGQLTCNKPPPPKRNKVEDEEEDVCFICFDGGSLVLCDRKGCPKAYHPACIKRDEAFFKSKAKWNCGWHICSVCRKTSHYMCYTCTYSLCKGCTRGTDYVCVRGNKGFCRTCLKDIMLIENKDQANNESVQVDFDDKTSWEYLFKVYWVCLKEKLSLTLDELLQAKPPRKPVPAVPYTPQLSNALPFGVDGKVPISTRRTISLELNAPCIEALPQNDGLRTAPLSIDNHVENPNCNDKEVGPSHNDETLKPIVDKIASEPGIKEITDKPGIGKDQDKPNLVKDTDKSCICENTINKELDKPKIDSNAEWASKDLLEFIAHVRNGDLSAMTQFDVQTLLLDYIKRNNLRDPHQKSQIICDQRLKTLFGKPRVGHIEMLKLIEFHFPVTEDSQNNSLIPAGFVASDVEVDGNTYSLPTTTNSRKRKTRKKNEESVPQNNLHEYAAIDVHNINLIYLKRNLMENLLQDQEYFITKVIGSIVRIRTSSNDQKQDMYRLVRVVGTNKAAEPYKIGERTTNVMLEVLNLDKKEVVSVDAISNQEFTEDECRRLRQSIRCGLVKQFTVGEIQKIAMALQPMRINDWLEAEILRLNHLRDRANEHGRNKELRECVEKLEQLKSPGERRRRVSEIPGIHADPKMNPDYESEEELRNKSKRGEYVRPTRFHQNGRNHVSPDKKGEAEQPAHSHDRMIEKPRARSSHDLEKHVNQVSSTNSSVDGRHDVALQSSGFETTTTFSVGNSPAASSIETEKLWHYRDPNGKIQGPFSMIQLRKWSTTGLFPPDMRIWTNHEQYDSLLLMDALIGHLHGATTETSHKPPAESPENKVNVENVASEGTYETNGQGKPLEVAIGNKSFLPNDKSAVVKENVSDSSWPHCWDLLNGNSSSADDVQEGNVLPHSSSGLTDVMPPVCGQESDDFNVGSQNGGKDSIGLTQNQMTSGDELQVQSNNVNHAMQSSDENPRPLNIDLSSNAMESEPVIAPGPNSPDLSKQVGGIDLPNLDSPTLETAENQPPVGSFLELLSPTPRANNEVHGVDAAETKQSGMLNFPVPDPGLNWSGVSGVPLPDVAEWSGYNPTTVKTSVHEWESGLASTNEYIATSTSDGHQDAHASTSHLVSEPSWLEILNAPIEFDALGEESVSDLLAEVDKIESQGALCSPTSAIKFAREFLEECRDDCFSSIEDFNPTPDPQNCDASGSTAEMQWTSQSSGKPIEILDAFESFRKSSVNSSASSEGETNAQVYSGDAGSEFHPPAPTNTGHDIVGHAVVASAAGSDPVDPGWGNVQGNINLVTVQGNVNLVLGGPGQGMTNLGWGTNPGTGWVNPSINHSPRNGSLPWDGQRKYSSERFTSPRSSYQGNEPGFLRGRPPRGRQTYNGSGGYSRPIPKGQRVCKFYESGHCKKGAFCDYLHP